MKDERRSHQRRSLSEPVRCVCFLRSDEDRGFLIDSITMNVSDSGVCLCADINLLGCSKIEISGRGEWTPPRTGRIMWCRKAEDVGVYMVGVSLQHEDVELAGI